MDIAWGMARQNTIQYKMFNLPETLLEIKMCDHLVKVNPPILDCSISVSFEPLWSVRLQINVLQINVFKLDRFKIAAKGLGSC